MAHAPLTHVEAKDATCTENGNIEYWYCEPCGYAWLDAEGIQSTNLLSVVLPAPGHSYADGYCGNCGGVDPDYYFPVTIPEALESADGWKVEVTGTVCVAGAWNSNYSNMNATIVDAEGNELYLYRLGTEVALGDIITVKGAMATYNGSRQVGQGATAVITGHDESYDVVPEYTIPEALAAEVGTNVKITATVIRIDTAWSDNYGNISVTVADENGNTIYVYRLATKVAVNDIITITGSVGTYNGAKQIAEGSTAEIIGTHTCSNYNDADCLNPAQCVVCGTALEGSVALGHSYTDGTCTVCGAIEPSDSQTTASVKISEYAAANGWSNSIKYTTLNVDENITVTATGGSNTGKYYTSGTNWRMYQNESPEITVAAAEGKTIVSVKITYVVNNTGILTLNGEQITSDTVVNVNASSITFSVGNTSSEVTNGQVRITAIEVIYA